MKKINKNHLAPHTLLLCVISAIAMSGCQNSGTPNNTEQDNQPAGKSAPPAEVSPPAAPNITLTPTEIKTFRFSWTDVSDETEYRLHEDADGASGYTLVATISADSSSYDHVTSLPGRINARYILQACNSGGCTDSTQVNVGDTLAATGYIKASNNEAGDFFGQSIAISGDGNTLAVGAYLEDSSTSGINSTPNDGATDTGAAYVFIRNGNSWAQQAYIKSSNPGDQDRFGETIALSDDGNTLVVGAAREDSNATSIDGADNDLSTDSGAAYVFTRSGTAWSQQAYVKASNTGDGDQFGSALALSGDGNTLAVGAKEESGSATGINGTDDDGALSSGAVYVFTFTGSWSQQAYVKASNTAFNDRFGAFVTLSTDGDTMAVTASGEGSDAIGVGGDQVNNDAVASGAVFVFSRSGTTWSQQAYVKASNTGVGDLFGQALALSDDGNTLAAGAVGEDNIATGINPVDGAGASSSGAAYVYTRSGSSWSHQAYIKASNTGALEDFGRGIALSEDGNILAVGAVDESSDATGINGADNDSSVESGAVYTFVRSGTTWTQQAYVKAPNTGSTDNFGYNIQLSNDGNTLAISAPFEDSSANGVGGTDNDDAADSGAVYLY